MQLASALASQPSALEVLAGAEAAGRLSGTAGARRVAGFLADRLRSLGLRAAFGRDFLSPVMVPATRAAGAMRASVVRRDGQRIALRHRVDFAEHVAVSSPGAFRAVLACDPVPRGGALWIPHPPPGFDWKSTAQAAREAGAAALVVAEPGRKWFPKSVHAGESILPVLRVSDGIALGAGDVIEAELPLERRALPCHNVIGTRAGGAGHVYVTAHYDHVGDDPSGLRFPGAVDNASGVVVALAVASRFAGVSLPFHLHFALLTGEESGLHGARALIGRWRRPPLAVINIDGVGLAHAPVRLRIGQALPGNWLGWLAASAVRRAGAEPVWILGRDDSSAFSRAGVPTVGLGQQGATPMHTPDDVPERLHAAAIETTVDVVIDLVEQLAAHAKEQP